MMTTSLSLQERSNKGNSSSEIQRVDGSKVWLLTQKVWHLHQYFPDYTHKQYPKVHLCTQYEQHLVLMNRLNNKEYKK